MRSFKVKNVYEGLAKQRLGNIFEKYKLTNSFDFIDNTNFEVYGKRNKDLFENMAHKLSKNEFKQEFLKLETQNINFSEWLDSFNKFDKSLENKVFENRYRSGVIGEEFIQSLLDLTGTFPVCKTNGNDKKWKGFRVPDLITQDGFFEIKLNLFSTGGTAYEKLPNSGLKFTTILDRSAIINSCFDKNDGNTNIPINILLIGGIDYRNYDIDHTKTTPFQHAMSSRVNFQGYKHFEDNLLSEYNIRYISCIDFVENLIKSLKL